MISTVCPVASGTGPFPVSLGSDLWIAICGFALIPVVGHGEGRTSRVGPSIAQPRESRWRVSRRRDTNFQFVGLPVEPPDSRRPEEALDRDGVLAAEDLGAGGEAGTAPVPTRPTHAGAVDEPRPGFPDLPPGRDWGLWPVVRSRLDPSLWPLAPRVGAGFDVRGPAKRGPSHPGLGPLPSVPTGRCCSGQPTVADRRFGELTRGRAHGAPSPALALALHPTLVSSASTARSGPGSAPGRPRALTARAVPVPRPAPSPGPQPLPPGPSLHLSGRPEPRGNDPPRPPYTLPGRA